MGKRKFNLAVAAALINAVTVGICSTYSSTMIDDMKSSSLKPSDKEILWIGSTVPLGAIFGGIIAGYLSDKIGRKGVMIYLSVPLLSGWLLISYANSLPFIYAGRFITGICCGLICVVTPMYIVEISTPDVRGHSGCGFQASICAGIMLVSVPSILLNWRWAAICASVIAVLAPLFMLFIPESPCWLFKKKKHPEAAIAIRFLYGNNLETSSELINENYKESQNDARLDVTDPTVYKPALLSVLLMFFQQCSGSNAILYNIVNIFKEAKISMDPAAENSFVFCIMFLFTSLSYVLVDKIGRKVCLMISGLITCVALNGMSTYLLLSLNNPSLKETYGWIPVLCVSVYIAAFLIGLGPVPWLMMSEMSPTHARSLICGLGTAVSWFFAFIITTSLIDIEHLINSYGVYWIYSFFCLLTCFLALFLPETKGKSFEEIKGFFMGSESHLQLLQEEGVEEMSNPESGYIF